MWSSVPVAFACLVSLLAAWSFATDTLARRVCAVFALGFVLFLFNPFVSMQVAQAITSELHHYRVFWVLPKESKYQAR